MSTRHCLDNRHRNEYQGNKVIETRSQEQEGEEKESWSALFHTNPHVNHHFYSNPRRLCQKSY